MQSGLRRPSPQVVRVVPLTKPFSRKTDGSTYNKGPSKLQKLGKSHYHGRNYVLMAAATGGALWS